MSALKNNFVLPYKVTDYNVHLFIESLCTDKGIIGYLTRENYMFGYCPTFTNDTVTYYRYEGKWCTWQEVVADLRATWRPVKLEEREWYINNIADITIEEKEDLLSEPT